MLELKQLSHHYPGASRAALQGIDLHVQAGECIGLLGSNGAGKTTLLSLISGVLAVQQGELRWQDQPRLGLIPQQLAFYAGLKVKENLALFADLYQLRGPERQQALQRCIDTCALSDKLNARSEQLSGGEQRRLNFAIGLLQPADLYLFDEATVGVDASNRQQLLSAVEQLTQDGKAVIYTSHYLEEVERVAQRILLLHEGQVRLDVDKRQLLGDDHGLLLEWPDQIPAGLDALLERLQLKAEALHKGLRINAISPQQLLEISQFIAAQSEQPSLLRYGRPSLEQLYLRLNGGRL
ncbi:ABC transporter ATP-binding protein [Pseudomonas sp. TTU2014-080ASC]|uniref:ABC transporter ATP-binding protein n=1 Tax=Pseudomonas sp. TTU2014-080ASC TaxID=1729724 RepID=UPI0007186D36|nr:ABC transporter ATP-binding protein [Pseudomonas sp. TTU2014-080ASC]KRW58966.1 ABC transporter [Pseudomonas sp. TTU2014-080ASC]